MAYPCLLMVKFKKKVFVKDKQQEGPKFGHFVATFSTFHSPVVVLPQSLQTVNSLFCAKIQTIEVL